MSFDNSLYMVTETAGSAQVCVDLDGATEVDVDVVLSASEDLELPGNRTAIGKMTMLSISWS